MRCCGLRAGGRPDWGRFSKDKRSHARAKKLFRVDQGRPIILATRNMLLKQWKKAIIIPFSMSVISFRVVFGGFFFGAAYFCFPDRLTIVSQRTIAEAGRQGGAAVRNNGSRGSRSAMFGGWCDSIEKTTTRSTTLWRGMLTNMTHHEHFCLVAVYSLAFRILLPP